MMKASGNWLIVGGKLVNLDQIDLIEPGDTYISFQKITNGQVVNVYTIDNEDTGYDTTAMLANLIEHLEATTLNDAEDPGLWV